MAMSTYMRVIRDRVIHTHGLNRDSYYGLAPELRKQLLRDEDNKFRMEMATKYGSYGEYANHLARERGFENHHEYEEARCKEMGFQSYQDYVNDLVRKKGFRSQYDYQNQRAKEAGYRNRAERDKENILKRGFESPYAYQNLLAQRRGFKNRHELNKWRRSQMEKEQENMAEQSDLIAIALSKKQWEDVIEFLKFKAELDLNVSCDYDQEEIDDWIGPEVQSLNEILPAIYQALGLTECPVYAIPPIPEEPKELQDCLICANNSCKTYALASEEERKTKYERWLCTKQHFKECQEGHYRHYITKKVEP